MSNLIHEAALQYAAQGIAIFPCRPGDKRPATAHGLKDASRDFSQVCRWWKDEPTYNIGLPTGEINNIVVMDADGDEGRGTWRKLEQQYGDVKTLTSETPKGLHKIFEHPGLEIKNAVRLLPGIDIRGDGGYIVVPPSIHPSGMPYVWQDSDSPPAILPWWMLNLLLERPNIAVESKAPVTLPPTLRDVQQVSKAALVGVLNVVKLANEGTRNSRLFWAACRLFDHGFAQIDVQGALMGLATSKGLPEREVITTIGSAEKQPRRAIHER